MTREEAIKSLINTKVYVNGRSKEVQEKLFSLGFQWKSAGKQVLNTDMPFLFVWNNMNICYNNNMEHFVTSRFKEITVNDILNIVIDKLKYRSFKDADECFEELKKHNPLGWVKNKCKERLLINRIDNNGIKVDGGGLCMSFEWAITDEHIKFVDGTPFGIKEG